MTDAERQAEVILLEASLIVACEHALVCIEDVRTIAEPKENPC